MHENVVSFTYFDILRPTVTSPADAGVVDTFLYKSDNVQDRLSPEFLDCINKPRLSDWQVGFVLYPAHRSTRSSESDGRSDVTDSLDCPDRFRLPW